MSSDNLVPDIDESHLAGRSVLALTMAAVKI